MRINPDLRVERHPIAAGNDCLVIDDFFADPETVRSLALERAADFVAVERSYPGSLLPTADELVEPLHEFVRTRLSREFRFYRSGIDLHTQFSLTTMQPSEFTWIQRLPHCDPRQEDGRANVAVLVYLFEDPELGGTGFYQWKEVEFWEQMTDLQREDPYGGLDILRQRFQMFRDPPRYTTKTNEAVELLAMVPARFNRLICYSGDLPHSAYIEHPEMLSTDAAHGRLTLNCFASVRPKDW